VDSQLVVFRFGSVSDAEDALDTIRSLAAQGFVTVEDGVIIGRDVDGTVSVKPMALTELVRTSTLGGVLGLLAGSVIGLPMLGALAGAGVGAKKSVSTERLEEFMETIGREMESGTAVVAIMVDSVDDPETVADRLEVHRDTILRLDIPAELRTHIDVQRQQR
jgi:uncharacterized membrane protein